MKDDVLLRPAKAAELLGISQQTLAEWRCRGRGPDYVKDGHWVRYWRSVILAWIEARRRDR